MDSIEAISRIQLRKRPMTDGRTLLGKRMKVEIADPRFKGISPKVVTNSSNPERIEFVYEKLIGIHKDSEEDVYDYYAPNEVPDLSEKTKECLKRYKTPVFTIGMTKEESLPILKQHGYITDESVFSYLKAEDVFGDTDQINVKMTDVNDPVKRRLAAKTVFNYLCFKFGKEFVLSEKFDAIRNYARYGIWDKDKLWFKMKDEPYGFCSLPNEHSHAVGWAWKIEKNTNYLMGIVTWFGRLTYEFILYEDSDIFKKDDIAGINVIYPQKQLIDTWMLYGDNENRQASEENAWFIIGS